MQRQTQQRYYTPEEYLQLEETAQEKHEYRNGKIIPMIGATPNHNKICLNNWSVNFYAGEDAILKFGSINWEISLKDIYQRIDFETPQDTEN